MTISELPLESIKSELLDFRRPVGEDTVALLDSLFFQNRDTGELGDFLFVFGSRRGFRYRCRKALELYRAGRAPALFLSGGTRDPALPPEAAVFRRGLLRLKVPELDILTEEQSQTTPENVEKSAAILTRITGGRPLTLLLVTAEFHMTRAYLTARAGFPENYRLIPCPAPNPRLRRDTWFRQPQGRERLARELQSLVYCVGRGWTADRETDPDGRFPGLPD